MPGQAAYSPSASPGGVMPMLRDQQRGAAGPASLMNGPRTDVPEHLAAGQPEHEEHSELQKLQMQRSKPGASRLRVMHKAPPVGPHTAPKAEASPAVNPSPEVEAGLQAPRKRKQSRLKLMMMMIIIIMRLVRRMRIHPVEMHHPDRYVRQLWSAPGRHPGLHDACSEHGYAWSRFR